MFKSKMDELYFNENNQCPETLNDLLDYTKKSYITNKIDIVLYKNVMKELYELGAFSPFDLDQVDSYIEKN